MSVKTIETKTSNTPWFVFKDVKAQNAKYGPTYSAKQKSAAETFADCLKLAYTGNVYINYRKKFIAVKLERGFKKDKMFALAVAGIVAEKGYTEVESEQGRIYRLPR